jgi:hypothetical protein
MCPNCGRQFSWYTDLCVQCGRDLRGTKDYEMRAKSNERDAGDGDHIQVLPDDDHDLCHMKTTTAAYFLLVGNVGNASFNASITRITAASSHRSGWLSRYLPTRRHRS